MLQVFSTQLYGREPHDHVLVRNPIAENKSNLRITDIVGNINVHEEITEISHLANWVCNWEAYEN